DRGGGRDLPDARRTVGRDEMRILVHDVQARGDARRAVRVAVRVAASRVRQHPAPLRRRADKLCAVIATEERRKLLAVRLCGERVLMRLASIAVERLADLHGRDPWDLMHEINLEAGRP